MAGARKLETNVPGDFFVNSACINCDTCRQLAPESFAEIGRYSAVTAQPADAAQLRKASQALLACPTAAIETADKSAMRDALEDFPLLIDGNVYYCGFTSRKSFGGSSYMIHHPDGNWMIDSPRFLPALAKKIEAMGGLRYIVLTHRDDVADAEQYAAHFGAERIIHKLELSSQPAAEHIIEGIAPIDWSPEFRLIPVPGHTSGHTVLLYQNKYLFTGDHLEWDRDRQELGAWEDYCWFSWAEQKLSMARLLNECFEWVLPGHGERVHLDADRMKQSLQKLVNRM